MQIKKHLFYLGLILVAGCSTKVKLNTEWKDTTIIYGLLDQNEDYHYIKINKAFLGEGDYYVFAQVQDSSEYKNVSAYVQESNNGVVTANYPLRDTLLHNRNTDGVFYAPDQTLYYFRNASLNPSRTYKLVVKVNQGTDAEKEVTGETDLVHNFTPPSINAITTGTFDGATGSHYLDQHVKFFPPDNSDSYEIVWRLKWDDYTASDTIRRTYEWNVGSTDRSAANSSGQIDFSVSGQAFFTTIANVVGSNTGIIKRIFRSVDVIVYAASDDLDTYININKPQTGLVQERPEFTNIGNGLGLFSSRLHVVVPNRPLSVGSYRELVYAYSNLLFCSDTTAAIYAADPSVICP